MAAPSTTPDSPPADWHYEPMALIALSLAIGIALDRFFPHAMLQWWLIAVGAIAIWWPLRVLKCNIAASCCALGAIAASAGAYHHACWHLVPSNHVVANIREEGQPICLEAYVVSSPRIVPAPPATPLRAIPIGDRSRCDIELTAVRKGPTWEPIVGRARLAVDGHLLGVRAGDVIRVYAIYQRPTPALNPGEFDFATFERSERRWCNLSAETPECVAVVQTGAWWDARRQLDEVRLRGNHQLRQFLSPRRAALAAAVMLGEREYLDADRNERFLVTGTVHLLAISGLNLGILVYVFWVLGRTSLLSRRSTLAAAIAFAISYALLTDAEPPVLRAAVLITVFCVARWSGRPVSPWHVLSAAGVIVLLWNPAWLFHVGAQLSFLAVAVLAWFQSLFTIRPPADPLDRLILAARPWPWRVGRLALLTVWQVVFSGTVIWLISFPLVWRYYNLISPVALALNPVVWLPMTFALFSGFAVLVLSWIAPPLGIVAGGICDISLAAMEDCITWAEPIAYGYSWLPAPPMWWIVAFYVPLFLGACLPAIRPRRSWCLAMLVAWTAIAFYLAMPVSVADDSAQPLEVTFVAVGHGAAILVELPDGRNLLYDCGRLGSPLSGARPISAVLWTKGITHLDAVVVSHADSDHYNALPEVLERFSVGVVYVSTVMFNEAAPGVVTLRSAIDERNIPVQTLLAGDQLRVSTTAATKMEVLHPPRGGVFGNDNANSIVLLIEHQGRRVLLTGDLEARGLADLMAEPAVDTDLLMVPHHGSTRSNPLGLAQWCRPEFVVISGDSDLELGRDSEVVARAFYSAGANVFHTSQHGAVNFRITREQIAVTPQRLPLNDNARSVYWRGEFSSEMAD